MNDMITEEILREIMGELIPKTTSRYVSCIRIDGSPILPPLINDKYRGALTHYRNLAILMEKKIKDRKKLKDNRQSMDSGVMVSASVSEPSCCRPGAMQSDRSEDLMTQKFDDCVNARNYVPDHLLRSDSSDVASPQNFISDDDMWKYLSNCTEGEFSTTSFDDQSKEITSCLRTAVMKDSGQFNPMYEKYTIPTSAVCTVSSCNESQPKVDICGELGNLPVEFCTLTSGQIISNIPCKKDNAEIDSATQEINANIIQESNDIHNQVYKSRSCGNMNLKNSDYCGIILPHKVNSENNFLYRCVGDKTCKNSVAGSVPVTENVHNNEVQISDYNISISKLDAMAGRTSTADCLFQFSEPKRSSKENFMSSLICDTNGLRKDPSSSVVEMSFCEASSVLQDGDGESVSDKLSNDDKMSIAPVKQVHEKVLAGMKISCSSICLPEYPDTLSSRDPNKQKTVKEYNPMLYGDCGSKTETKGNGQDLINCGETTMKMSKQWLSDHIANSVSEDSGEENSRSNIDEPPTFIDNSSASQKHVADVQLSESVSISEMDFYSSSVATIPPDTPEETGEIQNHISADRNDDLMPPKLVRQNSYTLIAPSPILLAHAKAAEKPEEKMASENDFIVQEKSSRKSWDLSKSKHDWNAEMEMKYSCATPYKELHDINVKSTSTVKAQEKSTKEKKVSSLPVTAVSSPVKVNLYRSSLDNLPIVSVRKFQEFINSKYNQKQLVSVPPNANLPSEKELPTTKSALCNRSSSLDLHKFHQNADPTNRSRSKSDLQESKSLCANNDFVESRSVSKTDGEMMHRSVSCNPVVPNILLQTNLYKASTPKSSNSNQSNQTDFDESSLHFSTSPSDTDNKKAYQDSGVENEKVSLYNTLTPSDSTVQHIFLQLQNQHSQLMAQLLDRQKKEQETLAHTFLKQQRQILQEMRLIPPTPVDMQLPSANSDTSSCSIEKKSSSAHRENNISDLVSVGSHVSNIVEIEQPSGNSGHNRYNDITGTAVSTVQHHFSEELKISTLSTPIQHKVLSQPTEEQRNAATVINAAARGYLIRRLLKTDYVQEIINTISESVQCALQLQKECPVDITPSDVELHRRLIQQLTAACYSLHDTFFSLSSQEKMSIIANDRERHRSVAIRPTSARSSISAATQKYIQRKQQLNSNQPDRPSSNTRKSWWRNKSRACSAGEAPKWLPQQYPAWQYEQSTSYYSKQPMVVTSKQQQMNNRANRRPWR